MLPTADTTAHNLRALADDPATQDKIVEDWMAEVVTDKGYHSNETMTVLEELEMRSYVPEPERGRRDWEGKEAAQRAVYGNRRRIRGRRGKRLLKRRGEYLERSFAHVYETGGMRRVHLRGRENILKRMLVHVGGFNLSLVMRKLVGGGTPRGLQGRRVGSWWLFWFVWWWVDALGEFLSGWEQCRCGRGCSIAAA